MKEENENHFSNSIDLKDENGKIFGAVGVVPSKELGKRDLILMDEEKGTQSARSITELINMLTKKKVSFAEKRRVLDFLAEKLRALEKDLASKSFLHSKDDKK
ncbi:MAG: hypothetical protein KO217_05865 [Methanobacteriaceae archaeon]|nr:hypothetical protein [Methanobacteriaceae archaeon]